eukprot:gene26926-biopygen17506
MYLTPCKKNSRRKFRRGGVLSTDSGPGHFGRRGTRGREAPHGVGRRGGARAT